MAASALGDNFENLDKAGRGILRQLAADTTPEVRGEVAEAFGWNFAKLDKAGRGLLRELAADRMRSGKPAMTRWEALAQDWQAAPRHPKRSPRPACHTTERRLRKAFIEGFRDFMGAFREASAQWRLGIRNATFPPWSYPPGGSLVRITEPAPA